MAALPNPVGDDQQDEAVHIRNNGTTAEPLEGWRITDAVATSWVLTTAMDGTIAAGATVIVLRRNRPMGLNNTGGDTIILTNRQGTEIDRESYTGNQASGVVHQFN